MRKLLILFSASFAAAADLPEKVDFNDHVQPILSEYCYHCHGPDSSTREPKGETLRLDREEYAFQVRSDGSPSIIKGDAAASEIIKRIITDDLDDLMPPPKTSHKARLKPEQVELLKKWINQGAEYEEHWSFIKPSRTEVPEQKWGNNEIDAFIAQKHSELDIEPNDLAEPHRILRRLSFDVTGLPPTADQVREFEKLAEKDLPSAVASSVDELLKTDAYAEHFGRHWLDAVRYGDTHGIHHDNYRAIWPYRDWIINAFRENKSFKEFTIEQIAGDLLPNSTLAQKIATGYGRCIPTTGEGGAIPEEYRAIYAKDHVETTSAVWLGLTTGCAACHDHKFDPISQKDFYALTAYFRNTTMEPMDKNRDDHEPFVFAPPIFSQERWEVLSKEVQGFEEKIKKELASEGTKARFNVWDAEQVRDANQYWDIPFPDEGISFQVEDRKFTGFVGESPKEWPYPDNRKVRTVEGVGDVPRLDGNAVRVDALASFSARDKVSFGGFFYKEGVSSGTIISKMDVGSDSRGWNLALNEQGQIQVQIIDHLPTKMISAVTKASIVDKSWTHLLVTYDGTVAPEQSLEIYFDGVLQEIEYESSTQVDSIETGVIVLLSAQYGGPKYKGEASFYGFNFYRKKLSASEAKAAPETDNSKLLVTIPIEKRSPKQTKALFDYYAQNVDPEVAQIKNDLAPLSQELDSLRERGSRTLVMEEKEGPAFAHILVRGEYSIKGDKTYANIPELFRSQDSTENGASKEEGQNRVDLAQWLVSEENPLTARVTVNRLWYYFFGRGLVETTEDFGIMGARPSHSELLDWLAVEFVESGWDVQHVIRLIVQSATYQLSDKVEPVQKEKDPDNIYLGRSSRFRLEAEQIRDHALASSGLLVNKTGGKSVKPYQPEGVWEAVAMKASNTRFYKQDEGDSLYRRSLYTFWKRSAAPPSMEIMNAPTREAFCVRRDQTNTPLQAFVTLNDVQFLEAARSLAENAIKAQEGFDARLNYMSSSLLGRHFENDERSVVKAGYDSFFERYQADVELAKALLSNGDSAIDESLDVSELATWTMIASQIFNLDENLTK